MMPVRAGCCGAIAPGVPRCVPRRPAAGGRPSLPLGMSEARLLALVARFPQPEALARRGGGTLFPALRRLEEAGLLARGRGSYRLTRRGGRSELALERALARVVARAYRA